MEHSVLELNSSSCFWRQSATSLNAREKKFEGDKTFDIIVICVITRRIESLLSYTRGARCVDRELRVAREKRGVIQARGINSITAGPPRFIKGI